MKRTGSKKKEIDCVYYTSRSPWRWVVKKALETYATNNAFSSNALNVGSSIREVASPRDLPSSVSSMFNKSTQSILSLRQPCTLRVEIVSGQKDSPAHFIAAHGISKAFRNLEDKDEFARVLSKCKCEHICPPTFLIPWDAADAGSYEAETEQIWRAFCEQLKSNFPQLKESESSSHYYGCLVLKAALGSRGDGIFFLDSLNEIRCILNENKKRAVNEKGFLESLIKYKHRIPSWVLQAEIYPPLLLSGGKKFHLRSYLLLIETPPCNLKESVHHDDNSLFQAFIYHQHEVRIASESLSSQTVNTHLKNDRETSYQSSPRNRKAYITNGAGSDSTQRCLLHLVPELVSLGMEQKLEYFMAKVFGVHLLPEFISQIKKDRSTPTSVTKFTIAGVDVMVDSYGRLFVIEVNVNPAAPPENVLDNVFHDHLITFMQNLIQIVVSENEHATPAFIPLKTILDDSSCQGS